MILIKTCQHRLSKRSINTSELVCKKGQAQPIVQTLLKILNGRKVKCNKTRKTAITSLANPKA